MFDFGSNFLKSNVITTKISILNDCLPTIIQFSDAASKCYHIHYNNRVLVILFINFNQIR